MVMNARSFSAGSSYRFGYQGQEIDNEFFEGAVSFLYRVEDPRIGRFLSVDPLDQEFPWNSPYAFQENKMGMGRELEGRELLPLLGTTDVIVEQGIESSEISTIGRSTVNPPTELSNWSVGEAGNLV